MVDTSEQNLTGVLVAPVLKPKPKFLRFSSAPRGMRIHSGENILPVEDDFPFLMEPVAKQGADPEPVIFDPEPPAKWSSMNEAIKAARWDLVYPALSTESYVGKLDIWKITDEQLLNAIPADLAYPIERESRIANRDLQLYLAGMLGALSVAVCNRYHVIASNKVEYPKSLSDDEKMSTYKLNILHHQFAMPCFLWVIIIGEMSVGKSIGLNLFFRYIKSEQDKLLEEFKIDLHNYHAAKAKDGKKNKETGDVTDASNLVKPWKTVFYDNGPTEAALHYALQYNPSGIAYQKDELASLFSSASMYHTNGSESLLDRMLTAYDGQGWETLRKPDQEGNDASVSVPTAAVPIIGGIQPHRLAKFVSEDDKSGLSARLTVTRAQKVPTQPIYKTVSEICSAESDQAEENRIISEHLGWKFKMLLRRKMIGEFNTHKQLEDDEYFKKLTPCMYSKPYHLGLSTEALVEFQNFKTYLKVSIENSLYGKEEGDFVDRDCDKILRLAGMFHVWQHCETLEQKETYFISRSSNVTQITKPISLQTLQRAIIVILYTMQTRRKEFPRFQPENETVENYLLAEKIIECINEDERFQNDIPFKDIHIILAKKFPGIKKWSGKTLGEFLKTFLCVQSHRRKINSKTTVCYRLSDAVLNRKAMCRSAED